MFIQLMYQINSFIYLNITQYVTDMDVLRDIEQQFVSLFCDKYRFRIDLFVS